MARTSTAWNLRNDAKGRRFRTIGSRTSRTQARHAVAGGRLCDDPLVPGGTRPTAKFDYASAIPKRVRRPPMPAIVPPERKFNTGFGPSFNSPAAVSSAGARVRSGGFSRSCYQVFRVCVLL